jgi:hypothetical protein
MVYKASPVFLEGLEAANNSLLINGIAAMTSADCFTKFLLVVIMETLKSEQFLNRPQAISIAFGSQK